MSDPKSGASDLVMTQADLPPGIDVPSPPTHDLPEEDRRPSTELLRDVKQLAEKVGGLDRLRELVDLLAGMPR